MAIFQPGAVVNTQGFGNRAENIEVPVIQSRPPASTDSEYPIGKNWLDTAGSGSYFLSNLTITSGVPVATWTSAAGSLIASITGTANRITVTAGVNPVIDIAATYVGQTSITTLGTIASGTWSATAIDATHGGTAQTSWTTGDLLYASASNTLAKLAIGSSSQILTVAAGIPSWTAVPYVGMTWASIAIGTAAVVNNGYIATAALTLTLPSAPTIGQKVDLICVTGSNVVIQASAGKFIKFGSGASSSGGTATSSTAGNSVCLVYSDSDTSWYSLGAPQGTWVLA